MCAHSCLLPTQLNAAAWLDRSAYSSVSVSSSAPPANQRATPTRSRRDLAARNIMLVDGIEARFDCKVADFGLARQVRHEHQGGNRDRDRDGNEPNRQPHSLIEW